MCAFFPSHRWNGSKAQDVEKENGANKEKEKRLFFFPKEACFFFFRRMYSICCFFYSIVHPGLSPIVCNFIFHSLNMHFVTFTSIHPPLSPKKKGERN